MTDVPQLVEGMRAPHASSWHGANGGSQERWHAAQNNTRISEADRRNGRGTALSSGDWSTYQPGEIIPVLTSRQASLGESVLNSKMGVTECLHACYDFEKSGELNEPFKRFAPERKLNTPPMQEHVHVMDEPMKSIERNAKLLHARGSRNDRPWSA